MFPEFIYNVAQKGHKDVVLELIKGKAEVDSLDSKGATPLYIACASGKLDVVKILVRAYANPHVRVETGAKKKTPISVAKENGLQSIVNWLRHNVPEAGQYSTLYDND
jgi:ankyrin repeat protein